jgi:YVTN family beta-propeller protein
VITEVPTLCCDPSGVAITPDGARVYVTVNSGRVVVIDTSTNTVAVNIVFGGTTSPRDVAITPDGTRAYVAASDLGAVVVIDTASNTVVGVVPMPSPWRLAIAPDGSRAYVVAFKVVCDGASCSYLGVVATIDLQTNTIVASLVVPVGADPPGGVAITPDGSRVHVTMSSRTLVIDTASNTVVATVNFGALRVTDVAISPF